MDTNQNRPFLSYDPTEPHATLTHQSSSSGIQVSPRWRLDAYQRMLFLRTFDSKLASLALQGRLGVYPPCLGQEAAQVGAALALQEQDWVAPTFRDMGVLVQRGVPLSRIFLFYMGLEEGNLDLGNNLPIAAPVGTQLPHAVGLAWSAQRQGQPHAVLAMLGDGATSKGDFHESLNLAAIHKHPVVYFCQNNQWALSTPNAMQMATETVAERALGYGIPGVRVDGNDAEAVWRVTLDALQRAKRGEGPTLVEAQTYRLGGHSHLDNPRLYRDNQEECVWSQRDPLTRLRTWLQEKGLWDEHKEQEAQNEYRQQINDALAEAEAHKKTLRQQGDVLRIFTYVQHPDDTTARGFHSDGLGTPPPEGQHASREMHMADALHLALHEEMERDQRVMVMGQDVGQLGGVFRVTKDLQERFGAERVIDTPLSESAIVGTSIGLALANQRPVCEIQFAGFSYSASEQLFAHAARFASRTQGTMHVPMVCRMPAGGGVGAPESHADSPEALFSHVPGLKVVMPSDARIARALLKSAIRDPDPVIFLEPIRLYRSHTLPVPVTEELYPIGKSRVLREGEHVTLVTYGAMVADALRAAERLEQEHGVRTTLVDLVTLSPLDIEPICASLATTGHLVLAHESPRSQGIAAEVWTRVCEAIGNGPMPRMRRITGDDVPYPLPAREHLYLPNADTLVTGVCELLGVHAEAPPAQGRR